MVGIHFDDCNITDIVENMTNVYMLYTRLNV